MPLKGSNGRLIRSHDCSAEVEPSLNSWPPRSLSRQIRQIEEKGEKKERIRRKITVREEISRISPAPKSGVTNKQRSVCCLFELDLPVHSVAAAAATERSCVESCHVAAALSHALAPAVHAKYSSAGV